MMDESPTREELIKEASKIANEAITTVRVDRNGAATGLSVAEAVQQLSQAITKLAEAMKSD